LAAYSARSACAQQLVGVLPQRQRDADAGVDDDRAGRTAIGSWSA
jgi:hypothetical protein